MAVTWWIDSPKNDTAGGAICWQQHADSYFWVDKISLINKCGFVCVNNRRFVPPADRYESYSHHMYFKFQVPDNAWTIQSAHMTVKTSNVDWNLGAGHDALGYTIKVYTTPTEGSWFPWTSLTEDDYYHDSPPDGYWNYVGEWEDIWDIFLTMHPSYEPYWLPFFDVTSEFQYAKSQGYTWFAVRLTPKYRAPSGWSYNYCPGWDEQAWVNIFGPRVGTSYTGSMPSGHPQSTGLPTPWLKIVYDTGDEQWEPGEPDNSVEEIRCIGSDYASQSALVGTSKGGLWRTWNGGQSWAKIYEVD